MKRTKNIRLASFRKKPARFALKPLVVAVAALTVGCSSKKQETILVANAEDCLAKTKMTAEQCKAAYQKALAEAERTGPRYGSLGHCEEEFGRDQCRKSNGYFMPFMTGFLVASVLDNRSSSYYHHPAYHYRDYPYRDRIILSDGTVLGSSRSRTYEVPEKKMKTPMPKASRTVSRGGFGSKAAAKSSWGGGKSAGGWGG